MGVKTEGQRTCEYRHKPAGKQRAIPQVPKETGSHQSRIKGKANQSLAV